MKTAAPGDWEENTFDYLKAQGFQPFHESLLLAVSGGMDSMALLHFWNTAGREHFNCTIAAAHVDHRLRKSSREDRMLVERTCRKWNIPFHSKTLTPSSRGRRVSAEMWGREERYAYFSSLSTGKKYTWVLTAHHLDDQLETVFLRLDRGTGLQGLQGIRFFRDPNIIRPFLNRPRGQLRAYAEEHHIPWREDPTNRDLRYKRNWFRWKYLPVYQNTYPEILNSIHHLTGDVQGLWPGLKAWLGAGINTTPQGLLYIPAQQVQESLQKDEGGIFETLSILAERSGAGFSEAQFSEFLRQAKADPGKSG